MEKKIATSVEVLIKVAEFESIRLTKYGESKIEYDSSEDMIKKEDRLNAEVVADLVRSVKNLPEQFPKAVGKVEGFGDKINKKIPEWLENGTEPNIANVAKKDHERSDVKAEAESEERKRREVDADAELDNLLGDYGEQTVEKQEDKIVDEEKPEEKEEEKSEEKEENKGKDTVESLDDELFDDEDLFE